MRALDRDDWLFMLALKYISLASTPIGEDNFAGDDVRYSSEFEALEAELAKSNSLHQNGGPDWQKITAQAEQVLQSQSKDLLVACCLVWGMFRCEQLPGLHAGLAMLRQLCDSHWDILHPLKDRTRSAALNWLTARLEQSLNELQPNPADAEVLSLLTQDLKALDVILQGRLGEQAPLLLPLCKRLQQAEKTGQQPAQQSTEVTPPPLSLVSSSVNNGSQSIETIVSTRDAHKALRAMQEQSRPLCQWWHSQSILDARAINLSRTLLWLPIEALPEHDAEGKTGLRGLPADRLTAFRERLNQGQPKELLVDLETSLARAPFWLDGQYLAWQCLEMLKADAAMQELEQQLSRLLQRLPGLEALQFFDGSPFASQETLVWIRSRVNASRAHGSASPGHDAPGSSGHAWDEAFKEASELLRKDSLRVAMAHLNTGMRTARGGREQVQWQTAMARLCLRAGKYELARNLLEGLDNRLQQGGLAEWEPALAVRVMRLLLSCYEQLPLDAQARLRRDALNQRLCHLDFDVVLEQALGPKQ